MEVAIEYLRHGKKERNYLVDNINHPSQHLLHTHQPIQHQCLKYSNITLMVLHHPIKGLRNWVHNWVGLACYPQRKYSSHPQRHSWGWTYPRLWLLILSCWGWMLFFEDLIAGLISVSFFCLGSPPPAWASCGDSLDPFKIKFEKLELIVRILLFFEAVEKERISIFQRILCPSAEDLRYFSPLLHSPIHEYILYKVLIFFFFPWPLFDFWVQITDPVLFALLRISKYFVLLVMGFVQFLGDDPPVLLFLHSVLKMYLRSNIKK